MTSADIVIILLLAGATFIGFFQGPVRGMLAVGAWLIAFLASAILSEPVGDYLATQWTALSAPYVQMLAFGIVAIVLLVVLFAVVFLGTRGPRALTPYRLLDDLIGGALGLVVALLIVAGTWVALASFYGPGVPAVTDTDGELTADLFRALHESNLSTITRDGLVPIMGTLFGPLVPAAVREALG